MLNAILSPHLLQVSWTDTSFSSLGPRSRVRKCLMMGPQICGLSTLRKENFKIREINFEKRPFFLRFRGWEIYLGVAKIDFREHSSLKLGVCLNWKVEVPLPKVKGQIHSQKEIQTHRTLALDNYPVCISIWSWNALHFHAIDIDRDLGFCIRYRSRFLASIDLFWGISG